MKKCKEPKPKDMTFPTFWVGFLCVYLVLLCLYPPTLVSIKERLCESIQNYNCFLVDFGITLGKRRSWSKDGQIHNPYKQEYILVAYHSILKVYCISDFVIIINSWACFDKNAV